MQQDPPAAIRHRSQIGKGWSVKHGTPNVAPRTCWGRCGKRMPVTRYHPRSFRAQHWASSGSLGNNKHWKTRDRGESPCPLRLGVSGWLHATLNGFRKSLFRILDMDISNCEIRQAGKVALNLMESPMSRYSLSGLIWSQRLICYRDLLTAVRSDGAVETR